MIDDKERCERVVTSEPINITAMRVMFKGEEYNPDLKLKIFHSKTMPPIRGIPRQGSREFKNLTGVKFGKFIVVGLLNDKKYANEQMSLSYRTADRSKWVVRCICGDYETRTSKAVCNVRNFDDMCHVCRHDVYLRKKDNFRTYGTNADKEEEIERERKLETFIKFNRP